MANILVLINRQIRDLSKQVQEYEQLLSDLQPRLEPEDSQLIQDLLSKVGHLCSDELSFWQFPPLPFLSPCVPYTAAQQPPNVASVV